MIQKAVTGEQSDRSVDASYGSHFVKQQQSDLSCAFEMADLVYNGFVNPVSDKEISSTIVVCMLWTA
jgi:hypothetical protein